MISGAVDDAVLSVDPGIRGCGCAVWCGPQLVAAAYVVNPMKAGNGPRECSLMAASVAGWATRAVGRVDVLVLEYPQTYGGRAGVGDANDLFALAGVDVGIATLHPGARVVSYRPHEWKGSIRPEALIEQVKGRLTAAERERVELCRARGLHHNIWDACGVGLKYHGRLERHRSFARD